MTPITSYILTPSPSSPLVQVDISGSAFASYQLYADNALVTEQTATTFQALIFPNQKIDVLGLASGEAGRDFSAYLADAFGDKVVIAIPSSFQGLPVRVYFDSGTGTVDYGRPIFDGIVTAGGPSIGGFGITQFGLGAGFGYAVPPSTDTLILSHRLQSGTYKYALVNYSSADNFHAPVITTVTVATRPEELEPAITSYDPVTDVLTICA